MKYKNFEEYLHEAHAKNYRVHDVNPLNNPFHDEMPEAYGEWLSDLDMDTLMLYADAYGELKKLEGVNLASEIIKNC